MYEQSLYKILHDHVKPKILKRMNRHKKWEYGYNDDHDMIVISKTGQIGDIYEIQNLKIALPKENNVYKFEKNRWTRFDYPKVLNRIKTVFDWREYSDDLKKHGMIILMMNLKDAKKGFGILTKIYLPT